MALIFDTSNEKARNELREPLRLHVYNCLDSCLTREIFEELKPQLRVRPTMTEGGLRYLEEETYAFARAMQAPVMDMMRIGLRVDDYARGELINSLSKEQAKLKARLMRLIFEGLEASPEEHPWLTDFNVNSIAPPTVNAPSGGHVQRLLYDLLALPKVTGESGKPSVDRDALEKLEKYPIAQSFCAILLALRDIKKNLEDLRTEIDTDSRIRTTFGVAATKTGRMASYKAGNGKGRNLQNIDPMFRHIYCADPGRKFAYIDLEQAESRMVGAIVWSLFGDPTYLDACESEDLHTAVSAMTWPHIKTRDQAEEIFYRNFSYRFMSKRLGHGTSYYGKPRRLSQETSVPIKMVEDFQEKFFCAFPGIQKWHHHVAQLLASQGFIVSLMGRKRWFMGRADEDSTLREAIAYDPQNSIAELLNRGLFRLWYKSKTDPKNYPIRCLLQVHDAVLVDYAADEDESVLLPRLMETLTTPITLRHKDLRRELIVPTAVEVGYNWGHAEGSNVDGLVKWSAGRPDDRRRTNDPRRNFFMDK